MKYSDKIKDIIKDMNSPNKLIIIKDKQFFVYYLEELNIDFTKTPSSAKIKIKFQNKDLNNIQELFCDYPDLEYDNQKYTYLNISKLNGNEMILEGFKQNF